MSCSTVGGLSVYVCVHRLVVVCQQLLQSTQLPDHMHAMLMRTSSICTNLANASLANAEHSWHEQECMWQLSPVLQRLSMGTWHNLLKLPQALHSCQPRRLSTIMSRLYMTHFPELASQKACQNNLTYGMPSYSSKYVAAVMLQVSDPCDMTCGNGLPSIAK